MAADPPDPVLVRRQWETEALRLQPLAGSGDQSLHEYLCALWNAELFDLFDVEFRRRGGAFIDGALAALHRERVAAVTPSRLVNACVAMDSAGAYSGAAWFGRAAREAWPDHPWAGALAVKNAGLDPDFADRLDPSVTRIFIAGCGRSGTYMLATMMRCFEDAFVQPGEAHFGAFAEAAATARLHVVKRAWDSYRTIPYLPNSVGLLWIVRHPLDVLLSQHVGAARYITPENLVAEIDALRHELSRPRKLRLVVRYEDLVVRPDAMQAEIAAVFDLAARAPFSRFHELAEVDPAAKEAMHGLRPPEPSSIDAWKRRVEERAYLADAWLRTGPAGAWLCARFGYEDPRSALGLAS